jgi:hypothetical protein
MPTPIIDVPNPLVQLASATNAGLLSAEGFATLTNTSGTNTGDSAASTNQVLATPDINGGTADSMTSLSMRDTSAAYDHKLASVSSVTATATRTTTFDSENASNTIKVPSVKGLTAAYENGSSGTFGANMTTWDTPALACDTKGGFTVIFAGQTRTTAAHTISLRVNGSMNDLLFSGIFGIGAYAINVTDGHADASPVLAAPNTNGGIAGIGWDIIITCPQAGSANGGWRKLKVYGGYFSNPTTAEYTWIEYTALFKSTAEITSVGLECSVANEMPASVGYSIERPVRRVV